jgi:hypothetical protein
MGRDWGGGDQSTSNLGPGWTGIAPCKEEGFQVSKGELARGVSKGLRHVISVVILYICIMLLCECG